ncbi:uncharacterized protein LOC130718782 [Lotus japonicus]|uniref:uncharacterized protein LOC130718782 n=1 Tax=Lotus japonicus TaxID=34305 RepID=UPI00258E9EB3|nr:uncharacterized protein LOC130718782 [Lotus japonicus]
MAKRKRHCRKTSSSSTTPQQSDSATTPQQSDHVQQHRAPIINEVPNQQPTQRAWKSTKKWDVDLIDDEGAITFHSLLCDDLKFDLPGGRKIVVQWDELGRPVGNGAGLLGVFLGVFASSAAKLPITYVRWPDVAKVHNDQVWATIKEKFQVKEDGHKKFILESLGKKWRDYRSRMFVECYDEKLYWETNLQERPEGVPLDQ